MPLWLMHHFFHTITTSAVRYARFIVAGFLVFILSFLISIIFGSSNTEDGGIWKVGKISKVYADIPPIGGVGGGGGGGGGGAGDGEGGDGDSCESDPDTDDDDGSGCGDPDA